MGRYGYYTISEEEARKVPCPKCHAKTGEPCVYVPLVQKTMSTWASAKTRKLHERVGKPCHKAHNERREPAERRLFEEALAEQKKRTAPTRTQRQIRFALNQFDEAEHAKLVAWLRENYTLFTDLGGTSG